MSVVFTRSKTRHSYTNIHMLIFVNWVLAIFTGGCVKSTPVTIYIVYDKCSQKSIGVKLLVNGAMRTHY